VGGTHSGLLFLNFEFVVIRKRSSSENKEQMKRSLESDNDRTLPMELWLMKMAPLLDPKSFVRLLAVDRSFRDIRYNHLTRDDITKVMEELNSFKFDCFDYWGATDETRQNIITNGKTSIPGIFLGLCVLNCRDVRHWIPGHQLSKFRGLINAKCCHLRSIGRFKKYEFNVRFIMSRKTVSNALVNDLPGQCIDLHLCDNGSDVHMPSMPTYDLSSLRNIQNLTITGGKFDLKTAHGHRPKFCCVDLVQCQVSAKDLYYFSNVHTLCLNDRYLKKIDLRILRNIHTLNFGWGVAIEDMSILKDVHSLSFIQRNPCPVPDYDKLTGVHSIRLIDYSDDNFTESGSIFSKFLKLTNLCQFKVYLMYGDPNALIPSTSPEEVFSRLLHAGVKVFVGPSENDITWSWRELKCEN